MSRKVLGLEIREAALAAVLVESGFKGCTLVNQLFVPVPGDSAGDDEGLAKALDFLMDRLKPSDASCVLGIPAHFISFRNLSVPFHDVKKIRQVLPFELEPTLPVPVDELIFDFEAVKRDNHEELLAFAAEKAQLDRYLTLLEAVNLRPVLITPSGYAAARIITGMAKSDEDFLFIDTDEAHHTVYAVTEGHVRLIRMLPIGAGGYPVIRSMEMTIKRTFAAAQENMDLTINPSTVFSMGPQSHLLQGSNGGATLMEAPIKSIDTIRTFPRLSGKTDTPDWTSGHLDMALALALMEAESISGVNFSTQHSTLQHYWGEYRQHIIVSAVLILLVITTLLTGQFIRVNAKERRLAELDRQIESVFKSTFPEVSRVVDPLQQMRIKIREAGDGGTGLDLTGTHARVIDILNALSRNIPAAVDVKVSRMVVGTDNVMLSGNTANFNTVDDIKGRLEGADIFKSVTISSADLEKSGKRVRFKLKLDF